MHVMFPWQLLTRAAKFRIVGQSQEARQSVSGAMTVRPALGARWEASLSFIAHDEDQYLAARAFLAGMEGMIGTTDVPARAWFRPLDRDGQQLGEAGLASLEDTDLFQLFGLANDPISAAELTADADLRATQIKVAYTNSTGLRPGHRFGIAGRLYEVQLTWVDGAGDTVVQFQPPLRASAADGDAVEIHRPSCVMRLASVDETDAEDTPVPARFFNLSFVEAI